MDSGGTGTLALALMGRRIFSSSTAIRTTAMAMISTLLLVGISDTECMSVIRSL